MGSEAVKRERNPYIDNVKGALILLVVLGHLIEHVDTTPENTLMYALFSWIYFFHMPLFLFVGGLFGAHSIKEGRFRAENVLFYFLLCFIFVVLGNVESLIFGRNLSLNFFNQSTGAWYLWAMGCFTLLVPVLDRIKPSVMMPLLVVVAVCAVYWISNAAFLSSSRVFTYAPIYAAGFYVGSDRAIQFIEKLKTGDKALLVRILAVAILIAFLVFLCVIPDSKTDFFKKIATGLNPIGSLQKVWALPIYAYGVIRLLFYPACAVVCLAFAVLVPRKRSILTVWGERSLQIYIFHLLIVYAIEFLSINDAMCNIAELWVYSPFIVAPIMAAVLGIPKAPLVWTKKLRALCARAVKKA